MRTSAIRRGTGMAPDSARGTRSSTEDGQVAGVYQTLRGLIVRGQLAPGARLVERDIATRLNTSRTPVRSALQRLQQERYVTVPAGGKHARLVVSPLTVDDAREVLEVVGVLESAAARRAALLGTAQRARISMQMVELNAGLLHETQQARPDQNAIFELDTAFHRAYVDGGGSERLQALHGVVKPQAERYCRLYISALVDRIADSVIEHAVIIVGRSVE